MKKSYIKYIIATLLFGSNGIVASNISLHSYQIVFLRTLLGSIFLIVIFFSSKRKITANVHITDLVYIGISGMAMGASWILLYEAYRQIGVSISSLLYYCGPVIVMILSPLLFKERLTAPKVIGFLLVLVGIFLVNGYSADTLNIFGVALGLLSAVMYSVMVMANKKAENIIGMENSLLQLTTAFLTVAIFVFCKNGITFPTIRVNDIIWISVLGLVNTGLGCYFYFSSIGNLPVQSVAVLGYIEPLSAVIFSVVILGEVILPLQIVGAVLIIGGAVIGELIKRKV